MEGNRRMGMAALDGENLATYASELEITECEPLPDGRFFLELRVRPGVPAAPAPASNLPPSSLRFPPAATLCAAGPGP